MYGSRDVAPTTKAYRGHIIQRDIRRQTDSERERQRQKEAYRVQTEKETHLPLAGGEYGGPYPPTFQTLPQIYRVIPRYNAINNAVNL